MNNNIEARQECDVAIIGGGFSGIALAYHLLRDARQSETPINICLFDTPARFAEGLAYSTKAREHLLNVRAGSMSISEDEPDSFISWLSDNKPEFKPDHFVPRRIYADYLKDCIAEIITVAAGAANFHFVAGEVSEVYPALSQGYALKCGKTIYAARQVVLALGNLPARESFMDLSALPAGCADPSDPWISDNIVAAAGKKSIAVLGAGLSAIDAVFSLKAQDYEGQLTVISRNGEFPQPHSEKIIPISVTARELALDISQQKTLGQMLRKFRNGVKSGLPWIELIDALRPYSSDCWQTLTVSEQRRFGRHLRHFWETHRHRVPVESMAILEDLQKVGQLNIIAAKVTRVKVAADGFEVLLKISGSKAIVSQKYDHVFNCAGMCYDLRKVDSALIENLIGSGLASFDVLNQGLQTDAEGQLLNSNAALQSGLFAIGSLRRGQLYETTAVRELRLQARDLARHLLNDALQKKSGLELSLN